MDALNAPSSCPALADLLSLAAMLADAPIPPDLVNAVAADGELAPLTALITQNSLGAVDAAGAVILAPAAVRAQAVRDAQDPDRPERIAELRALAWDLLAERLSHAMDSPAARTEVAPYLPHAEALARSALGAGDALPIDLVATYRDAVGDLRDAAAAWRDLFMKVKPPR